MITHTIFNHEKGGLDMALIEMHHVHKRYTIGEQQVKALDDVNLTVASGEMVAILGRSGSGKTTLMNVIGCLDTPSDGEYRLAGKAVSHMTERQLSRVRGRTIGFVFQEFHLLPELSALENVELPLLYRGLPEKERRQVAEEALCRVGLEKRMLHRPRQLSGGQQQRAAIARAIAGRPPLLLADEPTGNLDTAAGDMVMALLQQWHAEGNTVLIITHDPHIAACCPRKVYMEDGRLQQ